VLLNQEADRTASLSLLGYSFLFPPYPPKWHSRFNCRFLFCTNTFQWITCKTMFTLKWSVVMLCGHKSVKLAYRRFADFTTKLEDMHY